MRHRREPWLCHHHAGNLDSCNTATVLLSATHHAMMHEQSDAHSWVARRALSAREDADALFVHDNVVAVAALGGDVLCTRLHAVVRERAPGRAVLLVTRLALLAPVGSTEGNSVFCDWLPGT